MRTFKKITKIQKAIKFATKTHEIYEKQKRKGKDIAYITHPLTVGLILSAAGAAEDLVCAGILHDTIEDSIPAKKVDFDMLEKRFGTEVANMVLDVTEQDKSLSWESRKEQAIEHIKAMSNNSLLLKSADIVSNLSELVEDYDKEGEIIFDRFNTSKDKKIKSDLKTINAIVVRWSGNPLKEKLVYLANKLQIISSFNFMAKYPADIIEYVDYDENKILKCPICGWQGSAKESRNINTDSHFCMDVSCPICDKMILVINYTRV
jgi:hypothetical protein